MEEKIFFDNGHTKVTNTRFVTASQTYVMANITSSKLVKYGNPFRVVLFFLSIIPLLIGLAGLSKENALGYIFLGVALLLFIFAVLLKPYFGVVITSSSGIVKAVTSKDQKLLVEIIDAVNNAIVYRG